MPTSLKLSIAGMPQSQRHRGKILIVALIEDYEAEHYPMDDVAPHELLQDLMLSNHTQTADLAALVGSQEVISELVSGKSAINKAQAQVLGDFFKVSPGLFT